MKREASSDNLKIYGLRVEKTEKEPEIEDGVPVLRAGTKATLRLFGFGFTNKTTIGLTSEKLEFGDQCRRMISSGFFKISSESSTNAIVEIDLPNNSVEFYLCATNEDVGDIFNVF